MLACAYVLQCLQQLVSWRPVVSRLAIRVPSQPCGQPHPVQVPQRCACKCWAMDYWLLRSMVWPLPGLCAKVWTCCTGQCQRQCVYMYSASLAKRPNALCALVPCEQKCLAGTWKQLRWSLGLRTGSGRLFQADGPAVAKFSRPYLLSWWRGTCGRFRSAERRCLWLDSGTQWTAMYWGALPLRHLSTMTTAWTILDLRRHVTVKPVYVAWPKMLRFSTPCMQCALDSVPLLLVNCAVGFLDRIMYTIADCIHVIFFVFIRLVCAASVLYTLKSFCYFLSITFFRANFHEIDLLYVNRPFYTSVLWHCWFGYRKHIAKPTVSKHCFL